MPLNLIERLILCWTNSYSYELCNFLWRKWDGERRGKVGQICQLNNMTHVYIQYDSWIRKIILINQLKRPTEEP